MVFVAALLLLIFLCLLYLGRVKPDKFPPGPARVPLVGFLPKLERRNFHKQFCQLSETYGPVVGLFFANKPVVVVNGFDAVQESLLNDDLNGRPTPLLQKTRQGDVIKGMIFVEGEVWKEQRRFSLHHFRNLGFGKQSHETVILEEAKELVEAILEAPGSVELQTMVGVSSINILWAVMGGKRFKRNNLELVNLFDALNRVFRDGEVSFGLVGAFPFLRHFVSKEHGSNVVLKGTAMVEKFIEKAVEEHKANLNPDSPRDFIDLYLNEINRQTDNDNSDKDTSFTEAQLTALCSDIFEAGAESTSATLSFAILLLCLDPQLARKVQTEIDSVVGRNRLPTMTDRVNLPFLEATLTEILRFRTVTPVTAPHCALKDTVLQGYHIPARTTVMNNLYSVHMDREYWGDPEVFRPERFINPDGSFRRDERMISFGKGRRMCMGMSLARMTTFLLFATLMQHLDFALDPSVPVTDTEGIAGILLGPPKYKVFAKSRG